MSQSHKHPIPASIAERALITPEKYQQYYQQSVEDPEAFWGEQAKVLDWIKPFTKVKILLLHRAISTSAGLKTAR